LAQIPQPDGGPVEPGELPARWITGGPKCMEVPDWQVQEYNQNFYILRESGCTHYEKPFLYLIFGREKALLQDTGSGTSRTRDIVDSVIAKWLVRMQRKSIDLVVVHSHSHGDHTAGDGQFAGRERTEVIPATVAEAQKVYRIGKWASEIGHIDLGGRVLDAIPAPGHDQAAVCLYDRATGILLTGDNLYPGRLYVRDWEAFTASVARLVEFTRGKPVTHILGNHIEQRNTPFREYTIGSMYQPHEHALELTHGHLLELSDALAASGGKPARMAFRDFTIWPMNPEVEREMEKVERENAARQQKNRWRQPESEEEKK
jgi:glyoxylase-like metal-dependent hydrolase (beta-lactamase superfamily II)